MEDMFATLGEGEKYAEKCITILTHKGLFLCTPGYHSELGGLLRGIPLVVMYLDDTILTGKNGQDHMKVSCLP